MAKVDVIMRTKDRPLLLDRAIQSVIGQLFTDWHLVIINDGGSQQAVDNVLKRYAQSLEGKLTCITHAISQGMEAASNAGISQSHSDYIVIHDDDDSWNPRFLHSCINYMESNSHFPELGGVITHWKEIIEKIDENRIKQLSERIEKGVQRVSLYNMLYECYFIPICFLYKRAALRSVGLYDPNLKLAGDWEFNIRFLSKFEIGLIPEPLANYHKRLPSKASSFSNSVLQTPHILEHYASLIRNRYLRKDLKEKKMGLGTLMNLSHHFSQLRFWHFLKNDLKKIKKRFL